MPLFNHNGLDVETQEEVYDAYEIVEVQKETRGSTKVTKPALQHGTYSFFFSDLDDN